MKNQFILLLVFGFSLLMILNCFGQQNRLLMSMEASEVHNSDVVVRDQTKVKLIVKSIIPNLRFKTNHPPKPPIDVTNPIAGEWRLKLEPGTHRITFSADGFKSLTIALDIPIEERVKEIEIFPVDQDPPEIQHTPLDSIEYGKPVKFGAIVNDNFKVKEVKLFYRLARSSFLKYDSLTMHNTSRDNYQVKRESFAGSIEYFLRAEDFSGNVRYSGNINQPHIAFLQFREILKNPPSKKWIRYAVGSAVAVGSIVAILLIERDGPEKDSSLPDPPPAP